MKEVNKTPPAGWGSRRGQVSGGLSLRGANDGPYTGIEYNKSKKGILLCRIIL